MLSFKAIERSLGVISTLILVRVLDPADFGIVAMAMSAVAIVELFGAFGFDTALIHNQKSGPAHFNTAWTLNLVVGLILAIGLMILAPMVAQYYREPQVEFVVYVISLFPIISALQNIGIVAFRKELVFRKEFHFQVAKKISGFLITIPLAIYLQSYWALIAGMAFSRFFSTAYSYVLHPYRPRFSLSERLSLMGFSKWLLLSNFIDALQLRASDLVIGRLFGASSLGIYNVSFEVANLPTSELSAPLNRALLPGISKIANESLVQALGLYRSAMGLLALLSIPASVGIYSLADILVPIMLGEKWLDAIPVVQVLGIGGGLLVLESSLSAVLIGLGYPRLVTVANTVFLGILLLGLLTLVPTYGLVGAAVANAMAAGLTVPVLIWYLKGALGAKPSDFFFATVRPVLAALIMALVLRACLPADISNNTAIDSIVLLILSIVGGAIVYFVGILLLWFAMGRPAGAEATVADKVSRYFCKWRKTDEVDS